MSDHNQTSSQTTQEPEAFASQPRYVEEPPIPPDLKKPGTGKVLTVVAVFVGLLFLLLVVGLIPRLHRERETRADAKERSDQKPIVDVVQPKSGKSSQELVLPGDVRAFQETA